MNICEQITRGEHGAIVIGPPKSFAGNRTLTMPTVLCGVFAAHLNRRGLTAADGEAWLFVDGRNGPLRYEHWRTRVWGPAVVRAGMPNLTFHDLRRTNATAMVLEGVDMKTAQTRLGHSDPRLTLPCMRKQRPKRTTSRRTRSLGE